MSAANRWKRQIDFELIDRRAKRRRKRAEPDSVQKNERSPDKPREHVRRRRADSEGKEETAELKIVTMSGIGGSAGQDCAHDAAVQRSVQPKQEPIEEVGRGSGSGRSVFWRSGDNLIHGLIYASGAQRRRQLSV